MNNDQVLNVLLRALSLLQSIQVAGASAEGVVALKNILVELHNHFNPLSQQNQPTQEFTPTKVGAVTPASTGENGNYAQSDQAPTP